MSEEKVDEDEGLISDLAAATELVDAVFQATVAQCRSDDMHVYLRISSNVKGWADLRIVSSSGTENHRRLAAFSIACAAQAAGRKVNVKYWGYDPNWGNGAGHFDRVSLTL